jgi:ParB-like chromosome segregation protein Spo0J
MTNQTVDANMLDPSNWPALNATLVDVEKLLPYAKNSKKHPPEQVKEIVASIKQWGWTMPILVDETGTVIAGHGRLLAAKKLQLPKVPVVSAKGWSEAQKRAYVIADNKLTENGGWDKGVLADELAALKDLNFDLNLTGFDDKELDKLIGDPEDPDTGPQIGDDLKYSVVVECQDELQQTELLDRFEKDGLKCKALVS